MKTLKTSVFALLCAALPACAGSLGGAPSAGGEVKIDKGDSAKMAAVGEQLEALVVWSSSRSQNEGHDLFIMEEDGSNVTQLTASPHVDWFPRFSPDGSKILFTRSKKGWVYERDANQNWKWDVYVMDRQSKDLELAAKDASWGTWLSDDKILFSRNTKVYSKVLSTGEEQMLVDSEVERALDGAELQQPQMSRDGEHIALTLRGAKRETGTFDLESREWVSTGKGCQVAWHPIEDRIYWINPSGNGGSEVFSIPMKDGKPEKEYDYEEMRFVDIPGRRSHEYFPRISVDGAWMVWAATQRGHDHDIADYEVYIWKIGAPHELATRLTFHSGNDRWPDIFIPAAQPPKADADAVEEETPAPEQEQSEQEEASSSDEAAAESCEATLR